MCKILASEVVGGEYVRTVDDTWSDGAQFAQHKVAKVSCNWRDRLVELELRDGPVLKYILRMSPEESVEVAA